MSDESPKDDLDLVRLVQNSSDNDALKELINRHSGIYCNIIQKYTGYNDKISYDELQDDRQYNMYKYIMSYDPSKNMKVGTYIGQMARYMCLNMLNESIEKVEITEHSQLENNQSTLETDIVDESISKAKEKASSIEDKRFAKIFNLRHNSAKPLTWRKIGQKLNMSGQGALNLYNRYINQVQDFIK